MLNEERLLPIGRAIYLNNELEVADIWLEGKSPTHVVIAHTKEGVMFRDIDTQQIIKPQNIDINFLIPTQHGYKNKLLKVRY